MIHTDHRADRAARPWTGLRVVEICQGRAGPYAGRLLAALGAEVVKVEPPGGDRLRRTPRWDGIDAKVDRAVFDHLNAGKRSIVLDLTRDAARVAGLVASADVLIEDLGPGQLETAGFGPRELWRTAPRLVIARLSDRGQRGPDSKRPATSLTLQAEAGWVEARPASEVPLQVGGRLDEYVAGGFLTTGVLTGVVTARRLGHGVEVDVSHLESIHATVCYPTLAKRVLEQRGGGGTGGTIQTLLGVKPCRDGWVGVNVLTQPHWAAVCDMVGATGLRNRREELRQGGPERDAFEAQVTAWTGERTMEEVIEQCQARRVPAAPLLDGQSILQAAQWRERPFFTTVEAENPFPAPSVPWRLTETPAFPTGRAPRLDEHAHALDDPWPALEAPRPSLTDGDGQLPLAGIRVLDLGTFWAGASHACYLGAMGADVVKIESIQRPDGWRYNMVDATLGHRWWERGRYRGTNLNKRDITLDLRSQRGRQLMHDLVETADVMIENYTVRVLDQLGLDWDRLRAMNPRLVLVRQPGFGLAGPWRDYAGFGTSFVQISGIAATTGLPGGPPVSPGGYLDPIAGTHAVQATLSALEARRRTGRGQLVEVSQIEVGACVCPDPVIAWSVTGSVPPRTGNREAYAVPSGVYPTRDADWVAVAARDDRDWDRLVAAMEWPDWARGTERAQDRVALRDVIDKGIAEWSSRHPAAKIEAILLAADVPVARPASGDDFLGNPQLRSRGYFEVMSHDVVDDEPYPGWPMRFSDGPARHHRLPAPTLGQHNEQILVGELGLSPEDLHALAVAGVVGTTPMGA